VGTVSTPSVGIVGAGLAGLACASRLHEAGLRVMVFEKARGPSGRMSTRRADGGWSFDHGASCFTADDKDFAPVVAGCERAGCVAPWLGRFGALREGVFVPEAPGRPRWVGQPRMSAIGRHLASGLALRTGWRVASLGQGQPGPIDASSPWWLTDDRGEELGPFDLVVVAVPAPQAVPLLAPAPKLASVAASATLAPCLALMVAFERPLDLAFDAAESRDGALSWLARGASKPGRSGQEAWVAHASPSWSSAHLELGPEERTTALLAAFFETTGVSREPLFAASHRWRYARVTRPAVAPGGAPFLYDETARLGACGDWVAGADMEGAWCSGSALADRVLTGLAHVPRRPSGATPDPG
jgi:renalase